MADRPVSDYTRICQLEAALRELHEAIEEVKAASTALEGRKAWARVDAASAQAASLTNGVGIPSEGQQHE